MKVPSREGSKGQFGAFAIAEARASLERGGTMIKGTSLGLFAIIAAYGTGCTTPVENIEITTESREAVVQSSFRHTVTATYQGGFQADLRFTNTTGVEMHGWEIRLD